MKMNHFSWITRLYLYCHPSRPWLCLHFLSPHQLLLLSNKYLDGEDTMLSQYGLMLKSLLGNKNNKTTMQDIVYRDPVLHMGQIPNTAHEESDGGHVRRI